MPRPCTKNCVTGCFCPDGMFQNAQNKCVSIEQCECAVISHKCPNGTIFNECGSACPPTCDTPMPLICTLQCVVGCFCPNGMLQKDSECVPPDQCNVCNYNGVMHQDGDVFNATDGCNKWSLHVCQLPVCLPLYFNVCLSVSLPMVV
jgi:hypothetical protein